MPDEGVTALERIIADVRIVLQASLQLTEEQQKDLMRVRRLFYARVGSLARKRAQLLQQLPSGTALSAQEASRRLADINSISQQLRENGAAELRSHIQLGSAWRRGVCNILNFFHFHFNLGANVRFSSLTSFA